MLSDLGDKPIKLEDHQRCCPRTGPLNNTQPYDPHWNHKQSQATLAIYPTQPTQVGTEDEFLGRAIQWNRQSDNTAKYDADTENESDSP